MRCGIWDIGHEMWCELIGMGYEMWYGFEIYDTRYGICDMWDFYVWYKIWHMGYGAMLCDRGYEICDNIYWLWNDVRWDMIYKRCGI